MTNRAKLTLACLLLGPLAVAAATHAQPRARHAGGMEQRPVHVIAGQRLPVMAAAGQGLLPLYVTGDWDHPMPAITRAVVVVHGRLRNASTYLQSAQAAATAAGPAADGALLIVPQFLADMDAFAHGLDPAVLRWAGDGWMGGAPASLPAPLSSFDALDAILARLSDRALFPALRTVVVAGHSGGGQVVQRYAILSHAAPALTEAGISLRFLVANPSSYAYFDVQRPTPGGGFAPYDAAACPGFNDWKYGMDHLPPYAAGATPDALEAAYASRPVTYLLGRRDIDPDQSVLDKSCAAEAQGPFRLARGRAYVDYLRLRHPLGLRHRLVEVPGVGHDGAAMLISPEGLAALFGG